jgi:amylosucrase
MPNNYDYLQDETKQFDNRWLHRSKMNWDVVASFSETESAASRIYTQLKHFIAIRKATPAFADSNDLEFIDASNTHLLVYKKTAATGAPVYVIVNFSEFDTVFERATLPPFVDNKAHDLITGRVIALEASHFISAYDVLWLQEV